MDFKEVDLETPAGTLADSLAQIFMLTTKDELRQQAYQMVDAKNNRDFALAVEALLNKYFESKQRKLDKRSILQIRQEKDDACIILQYFLKTAGLPPDAVEKFSSKNLSTQIKKLERTVIQRNFSRSYMVDMNNDSLPGYQGTSNCKRRRLDSFIVDPSIIRDEFSDCSEDEISNTFLSKTGRSLSRNKSFHFLTHKYVSQAEANVENETGRNDLKSLYNTTDFDEFSDFSDEFERESFPKHDSLKTNGKNQFPNDLDAEFSSSDGTEFSSVNDIDFSQSRKELLTIFRNVCLDEPDYQFHEELFSKDDTSIWEVMAQSTSITNSISISIIQIVKDFISWPRRCKTHIEPANSGTYVLGIAGCSNSGKTTLSKTLSTVLINEGVKATVLSQDAFYHRNEQLKRVRRSDPKTLFYNYDTIEALDTNKFVLNLLDATVENDFVIVEGNMILEIESLRHLLHRSIFITLDYNLCEQRRAARQYDFVQPERYMEEIVWVAYKNHLANAYDLARRSSAIVFVDGNTRRFSSESEVKTMFSKLSKNLLLIQADELQLSYAVDFVSTPKNGGISAFLGTTRDNFGDKQVVRLEFEAYDEMVYKELDKLCDELRKNYPTIDRIALIHKVGKVLVGEASVIMAVSSPHRKDAFRAIERGIDYLKSRVPIWKKEVYSDDTYCWKGNS